MQKVQSFKTQSGNYFVRSENRLSWYESKEGQFLRLGNDGEWDYAADEWGGNPMQRTSMISVVAHKGRMECDFWNPELGVHGFEEKQENSSMTNVRQEWIYVVKLGENVVQILSRLDGVDTLLYPAK